MINHLNWSVTSTEENKTDIIKEKWLSLGRHLHNKHTGHGKNYKKCSHDKIKRTWFKQGKSNKSINDLKFYVLKLATKYLVLLKIKHCAKQFLTYHHATKLLTWKPFIV